MNKEKIMKILWIMSDFAKRVAVYIAMALIIALTIFSIAGDKKTYSENENRNLASFPKLSFETIKSGEFTEGFENYVCDHFPLRDQFMNLYSKVLKLEGKTEINDVYVCKSGYYIEKNHKYENMEKFTNKVNELASSYPEADVSLMLVPTAITIYEDKLPKNANKGYQLEEIEKVKKNLSDDVKFIDVYEELKEGSKDGQVFYKTDHHWTTLGAFYAFDKYCKELGLTNHPIEEYEVKELTNKFYGTISSKVNDTDLKPDKMVAFEKDNDLEVMYQSGMSTSLYNEEYLEKRDKYSYFLNNINDVITIKNKSIKEDRRGTTLLVYKDSYANCFVPFLTDEYENIIVLDTRYHMYGGEMFTENYNITDILVLYNMNTVDNDTGINGIY